MKKIILAAIMVAGVWFFQAFMAWNNNTSNDFLRLAFPIAQASLIGVFTYLNEYRQHRNSHVALVAYSLTCFFQAFGLGGYWGIVLTIINVNLIFLVNLIYFEIQWHNLRPPQN